MALRNQPAANVLCRRGSPALATALLFALPATIRAQEQSPQAVIAGRAALVHQYCLACHSRSANSGGLTLEGVPVDNPSAHAGVWEKAIRKLESGEMPPKGMPRPEASAVKAFTAGLIQELDAAAQQRPFAGRLVIRRLNRTEYNNAIRDLLAIELPVADQLPPDGQAAGFDNIGDALSMSPLLLEQYLKVARRVSQIAVGVSDPSPVVEIFPAKGTQSAWQGEGMPFGTRGGIRVSHYFPYDAEYDLRAFLDKQSLTPTEGVRFFRTRVAVKAGQHVVIVTFPDEFAEREGPVSDVSGPGGRALGGPLDVLGTAIRPTVDFRLDGKRVKLFEIAGMTAGEAAFDGQPGPPTLGRIEIAGPHNVTGVSETSSRERIFVCRPQAASDEPACAARILLTIARRAFRRGVTQRDLQPFLATYESTRAKRGFEASIAAAIRDVLLAPDFLFRLEFTPSGIPPGSPHPVSDFELASRLSFFLWSSIPDDDLLDAASARSLRDPGTIQGQVHRMLADPRASALIDNFAEQWLGLRGLDEFKPDAEKNPAFDSSLRAAFEQETRLFLRSVMRENRSVLDLLDADYTYLNERLAQNYGIPGVIGPGFRRVTLAGNAQRGGLLGQGGILMATSHSAKTSPVLRGVWVLDNLLNSPPPPPPASVPTLDESPLDGRLLTTREQVERHRADTTCASCHNRIDPLGFALENFDVIGRWRTADEGGAIDPSSPLPSGEVISGPAGLKRHLLSQPERFAGATIERLMTYGLGRELDARDQPAIRDILRRTAANRYRFEDLVLGIVKSVPFQMRQTPGS
jgi:mono/diheme cytochrome c family protein